MALFPLRGVLVEYGMNILGPIPNIVVFQFNPEQMTRTIVIPQPPAPTSGQPRTETHAAAAPPSESFDVSARFSAADDLGAGGAVSAIPRLFGVGPQIAALEKMVYPQATPGGLIGAAIDAVGSAISGPSATPPSQPIPRVPLPRILFIWGPSRVLPVTITSMSIVEQKYDVLLNPIQAEVKIGMRVSSQAPTDDMVGAGAYKYTQMVKDTQATLNLAKAIEFALDIIPF
ncbi:hypothetical protein [Aquabacterium sp.]|uniref:hypothetical protein n=1 Tax=Aquabacterium sp. TaxID=1872578 RepID=UPI003D6D69AC